MFDGVRQKLLDIVHDNMDRILMERESLTAELQDITAKIAESKGKALPAEKIEQKKVNLLAPKEQTKMTKELDKHIVSYEYVMRY
jgi:chaperonin cofactor prefoldin